MGCSNWFTIENVTQDIYGIHDHGEDIIYLVLGREKALLIDTGWGVGDIREVVSKITDLPLDVVNTHGHPDHVSGDFQFPLIYLAEADLPVLEGCFTKENRRWALENVIKGPYPQGFSPESWMQGKLNQVSTVNEHYEFNLGNKTIEVITIPGHSPGSIGLFDRKEGVLFSGDTVLQENIWMHLEESTPLSTYLSSLKKLASLSEKIQMILPAHGEIKLSPIIIDELINGVGDLLQGKRKGKPCHTFAGDGLLCTFNTCGIIYNGDKF